jgi:hypothetical protein
MGNADNVNVHRAEKGVPFPFFSVIGDIFEKSIRFEEISE